MVLIRHFSEQVDSSMGLRNLFIIMLLGTLGLRTSTLITLNVQDVNIRCGLVWVREKGNRQRHMILPYSLFKIIQTYLQSLKHKKHRTCFQRY